MTLDRWFHIIRLRLRTVLRRNRVEDELSAEVRFHLEERTRGLVQRGLTPRDAHDAAVRAFGGVDQRKEQCRDARRLGVIEDLLQDIRYAFRMMRRAPAFTAVAILSLALGIGANTAIFSAIDAVMLRALPVPHPDELLQLKWTAPGFPEPFAQSLEGGTGDGGSGSDVFPYATFVQLRDRRDLFATVFAFAGDVGQANIGIAGAAESARVLGVSGNYFSGIGVAPVLGRIFTADDDREQSPPVAIVSHAFWQHKLGQHHDVVGQRIVMNGESVTIVGVASPDFFGLEPGVAPDLWIPLSLYAQHPSRRNISGGPVTSVTSSTPYLHESKIWWVRIAGRLKPGMSMERAQAASAVVFNQSIGVADVTPARPNTPQLTVASIARGIDSMRQAFSQSLMLLMAMVSLVLLITCANLAGLLLERAGAREREIAVRLSLGVRRWRLIRQLLTESVVLAGAGGAAALAATVWTYPAMMSLTPISPLPAHLDFALDVRILVFTIGLSVATGIVFGLAPALRASRVRLLGTLTQRTAIAGSGRGMTVGKALVAAQIAVSLVLLVGAGLFARTLQQLHGTDVGFDRDHLLLFTVEPGLNGYGGDRLVSYYSELYRRIASNPGVVSATIARRPPLGGGAGISSAVLSGPAITVTGKVDVFRHEVGPQYFQTLGIPVVAGRAIDERDTARAAKVAVVNEALAKWFFGRGSPIGHHMNFGTPDRPIVHEIVGVVKDAKYNRVRADIPPTVYLSYLQFPNINFMTFVVRTAAVPSALLPAMRHEAQAVDGSVPLTNVRTQAEAIDRTLAMERTFAAFSTSLGLLALVLAAVGLYGTMAYAVGRRTNEIGIRIALGASRRGVLTMMLTESLRIVALGALLGIPAALAGSRTIAARLYGVTPTDAVTIGGATALLLIVAATAAAIPARRAASVDPLVALRWE